MFRHEADSLFTQSARKILKDIVPEATTQCVSVIRSNLGNTKFSGNSGTAFTPRSGLLKTPGMLCHGSHLLFTLTMEPNVFYVQETLKILTADSCDGNNDIFEPEILRYIRAKSNFSSQAPGMSDRILGLVDEFYHFGPNGNHLCLVFKPMGPDLSEYRRLFPHLRIPVITAKKIAKDLISALAFLHDTCHIIHTGE